jgi:hypothetical protein
VANVHTPSPLCPNRCFCPVLTTNWRIETVDTLKSKIAPLYRQKGCTTDLQLALGAIANGRSIVLSELL